MKNLQKVPEELLLISQKKCTKVSTQKWTVVSRLAVLDHRPTVGIDLVDHVWKMISRSSRDKLERDKSMYCIYSTRLAFSGWLPGGVKSDREVSE